MDTGCVLQFLLFKVTAHMQNMIQYCLPLFLLVTFFSLTKEKTPLIFSFDLAERFLDFDLLPDFSPEIPSDTEIFFLETSCFQKKGD